METKIIIPILNKKVTTFSGPIWYLSDNVSIEKIRPEYIYTISISAPEEYRTLLNNNTKCVRIDKVDTSKVEDVARIEASKIAFILNFFKKNYPVAISFAIQINKIRKAKFKKSIDLSVISDASFQRSNNYQIKANIEKSDISDFYKLISEVYNKKKSILHTLDRFNSALFRKEYFDKITDITISLESLISGTTELRNKFSLYNAWAAEKDSKIRKETYKLLSSLYDTRSAIVHGDSNLERKITSISNEWEKIIEIAKRSIVYHISYVFKNDNNSWPKHQENLVLGAEERIYNI